jgi:predicted metalloenzyme YecM
MLWSIHISYGNLISGNICNPRIQKLVNIQKNLQLDNWPNRRAAG